MNIQRSLSKSIKEAISPGRILVLLGPRRVGKTTIIKEVVDLQNKAVQYFNCDDPLTRGQLTDATQGQLHLLFSPYSTIVIDEAQRIKNIGITLKLAVDSFPDKHFIVSGSSSLDLSNEINEPLTGRKKTFTLFPLSLKELQTHWNASNMSMKGYFETILRYGSYPNVIMIEKEHEKEEYLNELTNDYLYKDALEYQQVRNPEPLRKLVTALALQIGQEVSYTELANLVGIDQKTVVRYIDLLEKNYVVLRLPAIRRNPRMEIGKSRKIYFYDLGIRNSLIRNFNTLDIRNDRGQIWENFVVMERLKTNACANFHPNYYFWRTYAGKEVDFVEEAGGVLHGYEVKWQCKNNDEFNSSFLKEHTNAKYECVDQDNLMELLNK
ncbi:ATP-binding protein [Candidatus Roizmanbacteria bacterium]|nr:ATP-binding protein [Candidatus Roizmanbacteria bacterium]